MVSRLWAWIKRHPSAFVTALIIAVGTVLVMACVKEDMAEDMVKIPGKTQEFTILVEYAWILVLIAGIICFWFGQRRLFQEEKGETAEQKEANGRIGHNLLVRLLLGNPTRGPIKISQLSLWIILLLLSVILSLWLHGDKTLTIIVSVISIWFLTAGISEIVAKPPHRGVYALLRKRTNTEMDEGYIFLCPILETAYPVNIQKRDYDVKPENVRTKDNTEFSMRISISWRPDPDRLNTFLEVGETNIISLLDSFVQEQVRIFFYEKPDYKPSTRMVESMDVGGAITIEMEKPYLQEPWEQALGMRKDVVDLLVKKLTGSKDGREGLSSGKGLPDREGWGIRILNVYLGPMKLTGPTAQAAEQREKEVAERRAEKFEKETESDQALVLVTMAKKAKYDLDYGTALRLVLDYKATMEGRGFVLPGTHQVLADILKAFLDRRGGTDRG